MYQWSETPSGSRAPSRYHGEQEHILANYYEDEDEEGDDALLPYVANHQTEPEISESHGADYGARRRKY